MRCTSITGRHNWNKWVKVNGKTEEHEGRFYQHVRQERSCKRCGYIEHEWLPTVNWVDDENE